MFLTRLLPLCVLLTFVPAGLAGETVPKWPGFLGVGSSPTEASTLPLEWSPTEQIAYRVPLPGYGQSAPIIWNDRVYLTTVDGANKEKLHLLAFDLKTGQQVFDHVVDSTNPEQNSVYISRAAPTPVADANGVYAYFEGGDVLAIDHMGKPLWQMSLTKKYAAPTNRFGLSASPIQADDRLVILIDDPKAAYLVAISKQNGEVLWKTEREPKTSWSSPALVTIDGVEQIVCSSSGSVVGYDLQTGKELWTFSDVGGNTGVTPMVGENGTFLIGASPGRSGENTLAARKSNGLMAVTRENDTWTAKFQWNDPAPTVSWASPMLHAGHAYWINRAGVVFCFDAGTGDTNYTKRIGESCWATPVGIGDRIYFFGKSGTTTVLKAGPEFEVLAENRLWSDENPPKNNLPSTEETDPQRRRAQGVFSKPVVYGAAVVEGSIVLRTGSELFCIRSAKQ